MAKYRVATLCQSCGAEYRSTAKDGASAPGRCKECKSSQTIVHPNPGESEAFDIDMQFIPVRRGGRS
jgi:hypothetical protein